MIFMGWKIDKNFLFGLRLQFVLSLLAFNCFVSAYSFKQISICLNQVSPKSGPFAVYQSLLFGLRAKKIPFDVNPNESQVGDVVIVLSGVDKLERAVELKRKGKISCLFAGPNVVN